LPQRAAKAVGRSYGQGHRQGQYGIRAQTSEVISAIEFLHGDVDVSAINRVHPDHNWGEDFVEVADRVPGPITVIALLSVP